MATLNYWICECLVDSSVYNIRAKTKKEVLDKLNELGIERADDYAKPAKRTIEYNDSFDLMQICLGEARGFE